MRVRLVSNAQTNNIKGIISTAQSHAKAQVNDIGFKNSFYVDGEPTSPTLRLLHDSYPVIAVCLKPSVFAVIARSLKQSPFIAVI